MNKYKIKIKENERIDDLECNGLKIVQNSELYSFSTDPILLVNFSKIGDASLVVDFCCGSGVIPMLIAGKSKCPSIVGVEIQNVFVDMANRSICLNELQSRVKIINDKVQNIGKYLKNGSVDIVFCNPPYNKANSSLMGDDYSINICKHEIEVTIEEIISNASQLLKDRGAFFLVHQTKRMDEIFVVMKKYKLTPKLVRCVHSNIGSDSHIFLVQAVKNAKEGMKILPPLIINNKDGSYNEEVLKMYSRKEL